MRALLLALLAACAVPRDRLGDDRVIEKATPLFTKVEPQTQRRGESVHMTAWVVDVEGHEDVEIEVVRCSELGAVERDRQCLATATEEVLQRGTPRREDELLIYEFDYTVPVDVPAPESLGLDRYMPPSSAYIEHIIFRTTIAGRRVLQEGYLAVTDMPIEAPSDFDEPFGQDDPPTLFSLVSGTSFTLQDGAVNALPAGDFTFSEAAYSGGPFFCTPGCSAPELPPNDLSQRLRLQAGASPRLYVLRSNGFQRFVLRATE